MNWVTIPYIKYNIKTIPASKGVYRFHSACGKELYIGKATSLCSRLLSHCLFLFNISKEVEELLISYTVTDKNSEIEKVYIKQFTPKYNYAYKNNPNKSRSTIGNMIYKAMDGRKQRFMANILGLTDAEFSKKMKGFMEFTDEEIKKINNRLKSKIKK